MTDNSKPGSPRHEDATDIDTWVQASRKQQGLPPRITDETVLGHLRTLTQVEAATERRAA